MFLIVTKKGLAHNESRDKNNFTIRQSEKSQAISTIFFLFNSFCYRKVLWTLNNLVNSLFVSYGQKG